MEKLIVKLHIIFYSLLLLSSCGKASASDTHIEIMTAPDTSTCYIIVQNGNAVGGNCK